VEAEAEARQSQAEAARKRPAVSDDGVLDDCGACIMCLDKPRFGGEGVRKKGCLFRRKSAAATAVKQRTAARTTPSRTSTSRRTSEGAAVRGHAFVWL
jgi:hypothetical protein